MPRQTRKYTEACKEAGVPSNADIPHEAVYGMLSLRGKKWDGKNWASTDKRPRVSRVGTVKVSAYPDDVKSIAEAIADTMALWGFYITSIKGPYPNKRNRQERYYINFKYEMQK